MVKSGWRGWGFESDRYTFGSVHDGRVKGPIVGSGIPVLREGSVLCRFGGWCAKDGLSSVHFLSFDLLCHSADLDGREALT